MIVAKKGSMARGECRVAMPLSHVRRWRRRGRWERGEPGAAVKRAKK